MDDKTLRKLQRAKIQLLLKEPFIGQLLMQCDLVEKSDVPFMATDGIAIYYNRDAVESASEEELKAVLAHEVLHNAFLHPLRLQDRDVKRFNIAADYAINNILTFEFKGFTLPNGAYIDAKYKKLSAEEIYNLLPEIPPDGNAEFGEIVKPTVGGGSEGGDSIPEPVIKDLTKRWTNAVMQAAASVEYGDLPNGVKRVVDSLKPSVAWDEVLFNYMQSRIIGDFTWVPPNMQYLHQGIYIPGMETPSIGHVAVAIDTSGSINKKLLDTFLAELSGILQMCSPEKVDVIYADAEICNIEEYSMYDLPIKPNPVGGGGTDFRPVFEYYEKKQSPDVLVYFTDLYGEFPMNPPHYPVLWAIEPPSKNLRTPFGDKLILGD